MNEISDSQKIRFFDEFVKSYTNPSFGVLPKKEVEILVLKLLIEAGMFDKEVDSYSISRVFNIPITKARSLYYEYQLRYAEDDYSLVIKNLYKANVMIFNKRPRIFLQIDSIFIRHKVEYLIRDSNEMVDYSFNRNILSFNSDAYFMLLEKLVNKEEANRFENSIKTQIGINLQEEVYRSKTRAELFDIFLEEAVKAAGREGVKLVLDLSIGNIKNVVSTLNMWKS